MATQVFLEKDGINKTSVVGFSWTLFFFGFFVPLLRGDLKWAAIMFILAFLTFGLSHFVFIFIYNKIFTRGLLEQGYKPADESSASRLRNAGLIS